MCAAGDQTVRFRFSGFKQHLYCGNRGTCIRPGIPRHLRDGWTDAGPTLPQHNEATPRVTGKSPEGSLQNGSRRHL